MGRPGEGVSNNHLRPALPQSLFLCNSLSPQQSHKAGVSPQYTGDIIES